jgi:hypothetical protein
LTISMTGRLICTSKRYSLKWTELNNELCTGCPADPLASRDRVIRNQILLNHIIAKSLCSQLAKMD